MTNPMVVESDDDALASAGTTRPEVAERLRRYDMAKQEHAAHKAWRAKKTADPKCKDKEPATPNLDALRQQTTEEYSPMATTAKKSTRVKRNVEIAYYHDGKPMSKGHENKLSTVAYFYSKNLREGADRLGTADFVAELRKVGVENPTEPGWMVTLKNGVTIEARKPGEDPKGQPQSAAAKADAPIKKAPATKRAPAKKAPAKKAQKQVTPRPKKGTAKKSAAARTTKRTVRK